MVKSGIFITHLNPNERFVFGSNKEGRHGAGAARTAKLQFGAKEGVGEGLTGQCYAFPTVETLKPYVSCTISEISRMVKNFKKTVDDNPNLIFYLTNVGCGLAGHKDEDIAPLFFDLVNIENVYFPPQWKKWYSNVW